MRAGAPSVALLILALLPVSVPAGARAQSPTATALPEITYDAPPSCPSRAELESRVRARVRGAADGARSTLVRLEVRIELRGGRALGQLVMRDAAGTAARRRIEAATCLEAVDALALIAALTLDPGAATEPAAAAEPPAASQAATEPESSPESSPAPSQRPTSARTSAAPTREPTRSTDRARTAQPSAARSTDRSAQPSEPGTDAAEPPPPAGSAGMRVGLVTSAVALTGVAPDAQPALQLAASLAASPVGALELAARAGVRITPEQSTSSAEGVATFAFWTSFAALCSGARSGAHNTSLWLCADFELGRMAARGSETLNHKSSSRTWTALGPAALAQWDGLDPLVLQVGAELLFPLVRDRFLIGGDVVHRVPSLGFRAELGVGVQIR